MNWNSLTPQQFVQLAQYWINQPWPLGAQELDEAMGRLGWRREGEGVWRSDLPVNRPTVFASITEVDEGLNSLIFDITDVEQTPSSERNRFMNDAFVGYIREGSQGWGKPKSLRGEQPLVRWELANGCRLELRNRHRSVGCYLKSPSYAQVIRTAEMWGVQ